jgi:uncharacterized membrane protein (DUF4010 family)
MGAPASGAGPPAPAPLPGWLGPVITLTTQVGVPTVVAGVLLWFVLFRLDGTLTVMRQSGDDQVRTLAAMQDTLIAALDKQAERFERAIAENIAVNKELAARYELHTYGGASAPPRYDRPRPRGDAGDDAQRVD